MNFDSKKRLSKKVSSDCTDFLKLVTFKHKHDVFDKTGYPMPKTFNFITEEDDEFQYLWHVNYLLEPSSTPAFSNSTSFGSASPYPPLFGSAPNASVLFGSPITPAPLTPPSRRNDDFILKRIEVKTEEKLSIDDFANVKITVDGKICLDDEFKSSQRSDPLLITKVINDLTVNSSKDSSIQVVIKIYRRCDSPVQIVEEYAKFLENEDLSDVRFMFGDIEIPAHKQILSARNSVFRKMFESDMLEKKNGRVEITDIESNIFKHVLRYIYSGKIVTNDFNDWVKVLIAADKYSIANLVKICENRMLNSLTAENIIDAFIAADLVQAENLRKTCVQFIFQNKRQVITTEAYKNLVESRPDLGIKLLRYFFEKLD